MNTTVTPIVVRHQFELEHLRRAVQEAYTEVAETPACGFHFLSGRPLAELLGYPESWLETVPTSALERFAGVGNPLDVASPRRGATVLDIGCGGGFDLLRAATMVGPEGRAIGVDMTLSMVERARQGAAAAGLANVEVRQGFAEALPVDSGSIDLVISNGAINLCPDKEAVYREIVRVLAPGGSIAIADVLLTTAVPQRSRDLIHLWTSCVAGGEPREDYLETMRRAGLSNPEIVRVHDTFRGTKVEFDADRFGARGCDLVAWRL